MMEERRSAAQKVDSQTKHIEPIFDASGTLRHIPSDTTKSDSVDDSQLARRIGHSAR